MSRITNSRDAWNPRHVTDMQRERMDAPWEPEPKEWTRHLEVALVVLLVFVIVVWAVAS